MLGPKYEKRATRRSTQSPKTEQQHKFGCYEMMSEHQNMFQSSRSYKTYSFCIFPSDVVGCAILPGGEHAWWKPRSPNVYARHAYLRYAIQSHMKQRNRLNQYESQHLLSSSSPRRRVSHKRYIGRVSTMVGQVHHDRCH